MFEVKIKGFKTKEEAKAFADWYSNAGEQDICYWLEARKDEGTIDVDTMDVAKKEWEGDTLIVTVNPC